MSSLEMKLLNASVTEDDNPDEGMLEMVCGEEMFGLMKDITAGRTIKGALKG